MCITPEEAAQEYYRKNPKIANDVPMEAAVRLGRESIVTDILSKTANAVLVERKGPRKVLFQRFRWTAWYCWLCGSLIHQSERPANCLCANCEDAIKDEKNASAAIVDRQGT
jgi:hypothetical protein